MPSPLHVGGEDPGKSKLECKVCHFTHVCIAICHVDIVYVHSNSLEMSHACIHHGLHNHPLLSVHVVNHWTLHTCVLPRR